MQDNTARFKRLLKAATKFLQAKERLIRYPDNAAYRNEVKVLEYALKGLVCKENKAENNRQIEMFQQITQTKDMAKETFYFSHDYNTRTDEKIKKLLVRHGYLGYGIFWALLEDLYNNKNTLSKDYESLAYHLKVKQSIIESVINDFKLFTVDTHSFSSDSVQRRLDGRSEKSKKAKESISKRWNTSRNTNVSENDTTVLRQEYDSNTNKVKESKVKENSFGVKETTAAVEEVATVQVPEFMTGQKIEGFIPMEMCKEKSLSDDNFMGPAMRTGIEHYLIPEWLDAFHRWLKFSNKDLIRLSEYRQHFIRWVQKIPEYRTMNPNDYSPGKLIEEPSKAQKNYDELFKNGPIKLRN